MGIATISTPVIARPFVPPVAGRTLKLIVHPYMKYDTIGQSVKGIKDTLDLRPETFNVLELGEGGAESFSGVDPQNVDNINFFGYFFLNAQIQDHRILFDGVNDFILAGGGIRRCLHFAFASLLCIKTEYPDKIKFRLFHGASQSLAWAFMEANDVRSLKIVNGPALNIHFNLEACYGNSVDYYWIDSDNRSLREFSRFSGLTPLYSDIGIPDPYGSISKVGLRTLTHMNRAYLGHSGMEYHEYLNGAPLARSNEKQFIPGTRVNIYYWRTTSQMAEYFELNANGGPHDIAG